MNGYLGVICVLTLFIICMFLGFVVVFIMHRLSSEAPPKKPTRENAKVYYITEKPKPKKKPKPKRAEAIPIQAKFIDADELKKFLKK